MSAQRPRSQSLSSLAAGSTLSGPVSLRVERDGQPLRPPLSRRDKHKSLGDFEVGRGILRELRDAAEAKRDKRVGFVDLPLVPATTSFTFTLKLHFGVNLLGGRQRRQQPGSQARMAVGGPDLRAALAGSGSLLPGSALRILSEREHEVGHAASDEADEGDHGVWCSLSADSGDKSFSDVVWPVTNANVWTWNEALFVNLYSPTETIRVKFYNNSERGNLSNLVQQFSFDAAHVISPTLVKRREELGSDSALTFSVARARRQPDAPPPPSPVLGGGGGGEEEEGGKPRRSKEREKGKRRRRTRSPELRAQQGEGGGGGDEGDRSGRLKRRSSKRRSSKPDVCHPGAGGGDPREASPPAVVECEGKRERRGRRDRRGSKGRSDSVQSLSPPPPRPDVLVGPSRMRDGAADSTERSDSTPQGRRRSVLSTVRGMLKKGGREGLVAEGEAEHSREVFPHLLLVGMGGVDDEQYQVHEITGQPSKQAPRPKDTRSRK